MSQFSYSDEEANRIIVTDSLLQTNDAPTATGNFNTERDLRKLLEKEMKLKWTIVSLSDYWRKNLIPRGLRIQKFPSHSLDNDNFRARWEAILNKCSMDLILLLIENAKTQSEGVRTKITDIESSLPMPVEQQLPFLNKIKEGITKLETDIKAMKLDKFKRDTGDYERGQVYSWEQPRRTPRSQRPSQPGGNTPQHRPRVSFNLSSGDESASAASGSTDHDQGRFLGSDSWPTLTATTTGNQHHQRGPDGDAGAAGVGAQHSTPYNNKTANKPSLRNQQRKHYSR